MSARINAVEKGKGAFKALFGLNAYLNKSSLEKNLIELIDYRVSQINGCAYCLDMHSKDLRHGGETEQRIYLLSAWRETDLYTPREKAALAWAEAVTELKGREVSDEVYETVRKEFSDEE
ncbi:MAG: carboxymuconolactone decarboxylase family protein, partial [Pyrinomonadaceae bacterium]